MLLTRAPLYSWYCYHFLVRLACVRHAASVDSEPGSNSRLKPDRFPQTDGGRMGSACADTLENVWRLTCENDQAKPDLFSRLACSTLLSKILTTLRLSGAVWIEAQAFTLRLSPNLLRCIDLAFYRVCRCRLRDFIRISTFHLAVKLCLHPLRGRSNSLLAYVPRLRISTG